MNRLRVAFRADASIELGIGHVMRCLTLANELRSEGHECLFICRNLPGDLTGHIFARGFAVRQITGSAGDDRHSDPRLYEIDDAHQSASLLEDAAVDFIVVDHYRLAEAWERVIRPHCHGLVVFDDLADRPHDCDLLLDPNLGRDAEDYVGLVPPGTQVLAGPRYALIRPEFRAFRTDSIARRAEGRFQKILVSMGGTDVGGITATIVNALRSALLPAECRVTVVLGPTANTVSDVQRQTALLPCDSQVLVGVEDMAQLMVDQDFAIGAAGSTSYERCVLALPAAMCILADNQRAVGAMLARLGAVITIASRESVQPDLNRIFASLTGNPEKLLEMSHRASTICDGDGVTRVVSYLKRLRQDMAVLGDRIE